MKLRCWGTRGSLASPRTDTIAFGGNTSCYEVILDERSSLLLDCGTGLIEYAEWVLARGERGPTEFSIVVSHFHWDHVLGFPFFHLIHRPGTKVRLYSAFDHGLLESQFRALFDGTYSPLRDLGNLPSEITFQRIPAEGLEINGARVHCCAVDHSQPCYATRVERDGLSLGYVTDHEARDNHHNERVLAFIEGVDGLLHDGQYTEQEYLRHVGWGHSSMPRALRNAAMARAKRVLLTHHDPDHSDDFLEAQLKSFELPKALEVDFAREHRIYDICP